MMPIQHYRHIKCCVFQNSSRHLSSANISKHPKMTFIRHAMQGKLSYNSYPMKNMKDRSISLLASSSNCMNFFQLPKNRLQPRIVGLFSSSPNQSTEGMEDDELKRRNKNILINPKGLSKLILPNQMVYKINPKTGEKRKVHEVSIGSFWMMKVRVYFMQHV